MKPGTSHCYFALLLMTGLLVGCGSGADSSSTSTSHDEISAFLEENPEFADPGPTDANPSQALGLEQ